jgi:transcriptional regulator with XRE-family HTH domain
MHDSELQRSTELLLRGSGLKLCRIADRCGISRGTVTNLMNGMPLQTGTLRAIRATVRKMASDILEEVRND